MHKAIKIILIAIVALILLLSAVVAFVCYEMSDDKLADNTQQFLQKVFDTEVRIKSAKLRPFNQAMAIYGFNIKDRKGVDMLHVDTLQVKLDFWQLWNKKICIHGFNLSGATLIAYKEHKDTVANYQFAIDAVSFAGDNTQKNDPAKKKSDHEIFLDLRNIKISRTSAKWDVISADTLNIQGHEHLDFNHLWVCNLNTSISLRGGGAPGNFVGKMDYLRVSERNSNTTISIENDVFDGLNRKLSFGKIDLVYQDKHLCISDVKGNITSQNDVDVNHLIIRDIFFENGIGIKKTVYPATHGHFDGKHVRLNVSLDASATYLSPDSVAMRINRISGIEHNSGLHLDSVSMALNSNMDMAQMHDFILHSGKNKVAIDTISVILPRYGAKMRPFSFTASKISANAMLQEIAYAFAPALEKFSTPLRLTTTAKGNDKKIFFENIHVWTPDNRLQLYANGHFNLPQQHGQQLTMEYNVSKLTAVRGIKDQIIAHFMKKKSSMDFIRNFGDITFRGNVKLPYRRQDIMGYLTTRWGNFNVDVNLNSNTYYLTGKLLTDCFHLGSYIGNKNIGDVALTADVKMDIAGTEIAQIIHRKQGKIPAGTIKGRAIKASYKGLKIKNVDFNIISDAETAHGTLSATGKVMDVSCDFSFDDADIKHSLKVKPHVQVHNFVKDSAPVKWFKKIFGKKNKNKEKDS